MYTAKNYEHLLGTTGFSDDLLKNHFTLYEGYVKNFNALNDTLVAMEKEGRWGEPAFAELNRRLGWEYNGMRLHELYFGNMTPEKKQASSDLVARIEKEWGSMDMWRKDFAAMGAMRGIGWVILYHDAEADRFFNVWINEHDLGHLAGATPLLVMDVFEHAFMRDYGMDRKAYIGAFMSAIDWDEVSRRLAK